MNYENISIEELEKLVARRDEEAICEMAYRCREGIKGVNKNLTRAFQLYHKGEKMQLPEAFYGMYVMYENGIGVGENSALARKYKGLLPNGFVSKYPLTVERQNIPKPTSTSNSTPKPKQNPASESKMIVIDKNDILQMLNEGENFRQNDNYQDAKNQAKNALSEIAKAKSGSGIQVVGNGDLDEMEIEAYWLLCFTSFNEKKYGEMEAYFAKPGVMALHPWGAYLCCIAHQMSNASQSVLENDIQRMIDVKDNNNLTIEERGDVWGRIGDLYLAGFHGSDGDTLTLAYSYYEEAANCGNDYALEQLSKFKKSLTGKVKYIG